MKSKHYDFKYKDVQIDPYRILLTYGITHPAQQHAIKKLLRAGRGHKTVHEDVEEVIECLRRWQEMHQEDLPTVEDIQKSYAEIYSQPADQKGGIPSDNQTH